MLNFKPLTICLDFDGTIVESDYPEIKCFKPHAVEIIKQLINDGHYIVISTCRIKDYETDAKQFLKNAGITYHAFNENNPMRVEKYNGDCRKISADVYFDDLAYPQLEINWLGFYDFIRNKAVM